MNKLQLLSLLTVLLCGLALVSTVLAQTSTNYGLEWHVVGSGGGRMGSTSYAVEGTVGQLAAGDTSSTNYELSEGYWYLVQYQLYLPLILREHT